MIRIPRHRHFWPRTKLLLKNPRSVTENGKSKSYRKTTKSRPQSVMLKTTRRNTCTLDVKLHVALTCSRDKLSSVCENVSWESAVIRVVFVGEKPGNFPLTGTDLPSHWFFWKLNGMERGRGGKGEREGWETTCLTPPPSPLASASSTTLAVIVVAADSRRVLINLQVLRRCGRIYS